MELQEFDVWIYSDDGTLEKAPLCRQWQEKIDEASTKFGKQMNVAYRFKGQMEDAGFVDVVDDVYKVGTSSVLLIKNRDANPIMTGPVLALGQGS